MRLRRLSGTGSRSFESGAADKSWTYTNLPTIGRILSTMKRLDSHSSVMSGRRLSYWSRTGRSQRQAVVEHVRQ